MEQINKILDKKGLTPQQKVEFEFQDLCLSLEEFFGKEHKSRIWSLPYQPWFTENKGWQALDKIKKVDKEKQNLNYYIGIVMKIC